MFPTFYLYLIFAESLRGAAIGKKLLGLRVVSDEQPGWPRLSRAFVRSGIYVAFLVLANSATDLWRSVMAEAVELRFLADLLATAVSASSFLVLLSLVFVTARRRNGFAALHDLASRSRVVQRATVPHARVADRAAALDLETWSMTGDRIGPYGLVADAPVVPPVGLVVGFDEALRRPVWIERSSADAPPVPRARRDLSRPARLRWLGGSRVGESWDAYEAVVGEPLVPRTGKRMAWRDVQHVLALLAQELRAGMTDGSLPCLSIDRVWILPGGGVRLCEWPARLAGSAPDPVSADKSHVDLTEALAFLHSVAVTALASAPTDPTGTRRAPGVRLPLSARRFLADLHHGRMESLEDVTQRLAALRDQPQVVSVPRRAVHLALCGLLPTQMALFTVAVSVAFPPDTIFGQASESSRYLLLVGTSGLLVVMVVSLPLALLARGGLLLRLLRIAVVDRKGEEVSRSRALGRALVAWARCGSCCFWSGSDRGLLSRVASCRTRPAGS